ncbi:MAG: polyphosphate kinase 1 [Myxococcota bacterium]|nr:polyphosphate kinase 1 [Myxococcota bacterium]
MSQIPPSRPAPTSPPGAGGASPSNEAPDLRSEALYLNRELSWLEFNARVLAEADSESVPLLERLKFHGIVSSNLDEFFMVRVAGLKQQLTGEVDEMGPDGMTVAEQLSAVAARVHELVAAQSQSLGALLPKLADAGIVFLRAKDVSPEALAELDSRFNNEVFPILTPIAIDPGHPFPQVRNRSLNLGVMFTREGTLEHGFGVVQVPSMLPRLLAVSGAKTPSGQPAARAYVLLEDLVARHVSTIFPGVRVDGLYVFRVTRNFDIEVDEEEAEDLLQSIQQELRRRERGNAVRLEVAGDAPAGSLAKLVKALKLDPEKDVYHVSGMLNLADLMSIARYEARGLRDEPFTPHAVPPLRDADDFFAVIREQDVLLYHPYESFEGVVELIARAAEDPDVLAIKQTLYRAGGDSPIVKSLARAAESGKQVTAIVELKARFDEESNIAWARMLEQAGVHVVYGLLGLKTHAKCLLIVRREKGKLRRYAHVSTGNYNPTTARLYTDFSLLTARPDVCEDVSSLFNLLTGYSAPPRWNKLIVAPLGLHESVLALIAREAEHARAGRPARIIAKMNSLVDADVIESLYCASQMGVPITLLVRGICCLRPRVPRVSETIEVRALVDRFLEHGRAFHFVNGGKDEVYMGSADWMPRNFHRRVEAMLPIDDPLLKARLIEMMQLQIADNVKSWLLKTDGKYERVQPRPGAPLVRAQAKLIEMTRDRIKSADMAATGGRFNLLSTRKLDGKGAETRRVRRDPREGRKAR